MKSQRKKFYVYLLKCKDKSLYCGMTSDLDNRLLLHNSGKGSSYVRSRGGGKMVYNETHLTKGDAMRREYEIKNWPRSRKLLLVGNRSKQKRS